MTQCEQTSQCFAWQHFTRACTCELHVHADLSTQASVQWAHGGSLLGLGCCLVARKCEVETSASFLLWLFLLAEAMQTGWQDAMQLVLAPEPQSGASTYAAHALEV